MENGHIIEIDRLSLRFGERDVLSGFSLHVATGERVIITGTSGSGKSTLLRCILGFDTPDSGSISIGGERVGPDTTWQVRRRLAYVQQEPDLGMGTVRDIVQHPFSYRANGHLSYSEERADELFHRLRLPAGIKDQEMTQLSGGEKQRVAIAIAMLLERDLILLDEPASALDREVGGLVAGYFRNDYKGTILAVVHHPEQFPMGGRVVDLSRETAGVQS